jgi:hypothetical protein
LPGKHCPAGERAMDQNKKPRQSKDLTGFFASNKWCEGGDSNPYTLAGVRT